MKKVELFSIVNISDQASNLLVNGKKSNAIIAGVILEEQFELENGFHLIMTTDNCPYEEFLHIFLFDQSLNLLERVDIGQVYQSAALENVKIEKQESLKFNFLKGYSFRLIIHSEKKRFFKIFFSNGLIHYRHKFEKKRMIVEVEEVVDK